SRIHSSASGPSTIRAARCGIATMPPAASAVAASSVASSPWAGEAVTVTRDPAGRCSSTRSAIPGSGITSNCACRDAGLGGGGPRGPHAAAGPAGAPRGGGVPGGGSDVALGRALRGVDERLGHHGRGHRRDGGGGPGAGALAAVDREPRAEGGESAGTRAR